MDGADGVVHLQDAAHELVAAGRSFLDAVEEVVEDNDRLSGLMSGVTDVLSQVTSAVSKLGNNPPRANREERVRHIVVE